MTKCPHCGATIIQGDRMCGTCGVALESPTPPGAAPPGSRFSGAAYAAPPPPLPPVARPASGAAPTAPPPGFAPPPIPSPGFPSPPPPPPGAPAGYGAPPGLPSLPPASGVLMPSRPPRHKRGWTGWVAALGALVVVAVVAVATFVFLTRNAHDYPSHWDAQIQPIADRVAALRGLTFEHPVKVEYLSAADFEKQVTSSPEDLKNQKDEIDQATAVFRAAGLIGGNVDLGRAVNDTQSADVIALYDPDSKKILVRGTGPLTIETRVTLAHELTHVLQDQHFDLKKLQKQADDSKTGSSDALRGLVEGDAVRIEKKYLAEQSATDRATYRRLSDATSSAADQAGNDLPPVIETYFGAPYIFGPQVVSILEGSGGNQAIDAALTGPTPTTRIYLDPTAVNQTPDVPPPVPALRAGETKLSTETANDEDFDNFTLYLMLSARLDALTALRAADAYSAGSMAGYTRGGTTCFRASIAGANAASNTFLARVLRSWAKTMPDAAVESDVGLITFHSCDPGKRAIEPSKAAIRAADSLAATRGQLTQTFITNNHASADLATCLSRVLMQMPRFRAALSSETKAAFDEGIHDGAIAGAACRRDPLSGIP